MAELHVLSRTTAPWSYWAQLNAAQQQSLAGRVRTDLGDAQAPIERLGADTGLAVPECSDALRGVRWLASLPEQPTDTTVITLSTIAWSGDSVTGLIYVGLSNRWVGRGLIYQVRQEQGLWRIAHSATAWIQ